MPPCPKNLRSLCASLSTFQHDRRLDIISFSPSGGDVPLDQAQCKIVNHLRVVNGRTGLVEEIKKIVNCSPGRRLVVDLVAHSTSNDQVMSFGGWQMRDLAVEGVNVLHQTFLEMSSLADRIAMIRLIGCQTGNSPAGYAALQMIHQTMKRKVAVYGTISDVNVNSFSESQYMSPYLQSATQPPNVPAVAAAPELLGERVEETVYQALFSEMAPPGASEGRIFEELQSCLEVSSAMTSPGLLLQPSWSGAHAPQLAVDLFAERRLLRIWSLDFSKSLIFRVKDFMRLEKVLRSFKAKPAAPSPPV